MNMSSTRPMAPVQSPEKAYQCERDERERERHLDGQLLQARQDDDEREGSSGCADARSDGDFGMLLPVVPPHALCAGEVVPRAERSA